VQVLTTLCRLIEPLSRAFLAREATTDVRATHPRCLEGHGQSWLSPSHWVTNERTEHKRYGNSASAAISHFPISGNLMKHHHSKSSAISPLSQDRSVPSLVYIQYNSISMRRRQHPTPLMSEPDMDPMDNEDPEAMLEDADKRPFLSPFGIDNDDNKNNKSLSLWPRNYSGRRRLVIAGLCFIFGVAIVVKNYSNGKQNPLFLFP
jgi:hypothetical protein